MKNVVTLVLGGGRGTRLYPLTKFRSKPAVPLAGKYRLIDIPLSNCINSGLNRIYVLTQFMSVSLHRHIRRTYNFDAFDGGFVEVLAAQQTLESNDWFQGTADAVRQHMGYIRGSDVQHVLILSGDQLYRMNFEKMLAEHRESGADVSIAAMPVDSSQASGLGVMRADDSGRVTGFLEKPKTQQEIDMVRVDPAWIDRQGVESKGRDCLASMGIYLFNRDVLVDSLEKTDYQDFGKEIFPASIRSRHVHMHLFDDYWEDIGTIDAFYEANLALTRPDPPFDMVEAESPIYTRARFLPPSRVDGATVTGSLIGDGCTIGRGAVIENSVIGVRSHIGNDCVIRNSVLMGADFYEKTSDDASQIPLGVGPRSVIEGAIIDKNCRIGADCRITKNGDVAEKDELDGWMIRDGILVTIKNAEFPNGYHTN